MMMNVAVTGRGPCSASPLPPRLLDLAPWLQLLGGVLAFLVIGIFTSAHSELAAYISPGESPAFAGARGYATELLWFGLAYLLVTAGLQFWGLRARSRRRPLGIKVLAGVELAAIAGLAVTLTQGWGAALPWAHTLLQLSLLAQVFATLRLSETGEPDPSLNVADAKARVPSPFLAFLFLLAAAPAYLDPSWQRMLQHVQWDSDSELLLGRLLPAAFSGVTGLWVGLGTLVGLAGLWALRVRMNDRSPLRPWVSLFPFLFLPGWYAALSLAPLFSAMEWELSGLHLKGALPPLFILLCGGGGALSYAAFRRLAAHAPQAREKSPIGLIGLSMGAGMLLPVTWLLTRPGSGRWSWWALLGSSLLGSVGLGYYVLFGDLFNPWFTVLSYAKGAILKVTAVVGAGILTVIFEELLPARPRPASRRRWAGLALLFLLGFLPFAGVERYPQTKAEILQYHELGMVEATYGRVVSGLLGMGRWIRLGQDPEGSHHPRVWPLPWVLEKTGPSLLPEGFNLIVVIVDALRGDAFYSAGYHRNLTPFLDRWAREEAVSFRRAYTQGGGTFAALPFLVAGRSRLTLYGPDLFRENLYFKLAQAEGIRTVMVVKGFGPRAIFPPDFPVVELGGPNPGADRRSVPADTVFGWAQEAIDRLAEGERFLAFLHLMDVHNELWKKEDGLDFGDSPRDLYDNNLSYVDRAFERFVAWLKRKGIYHRTVIFFTADHGEQFWEHGASLHGHTLYEEEIRIPAVLLAHGIRKRVDDVPVVAADMAPTLVEMAGYSVHPPYDDPRMGISLLPLLLGEDRHRYLRRDIVGRASFKRRYFLYRNWEWKLVYAAEFDLFHLFNTVRDPMERRNFLREEPELAAELEQALFGYLARVEGKSYRPLLSTAGRS